MKRIFIDNIFFRIICPPLYGTVIYLLMLMVFDNLSHLEENFLREELLICIALAYLILESLRAVVKWYDKQYPWEYRFMFRAGLQIATHVATSIAIVSFSLFAYFKWYAGYNFFSTELIALNSLFLIIVIIYNLLYFGLVYMHKQHHIQMDREEQARKNFEYRLVSLRQEVNSDFLYDSLESLISLIRTDHQKSEDLILHLSDVYRYKLEHKQDELVTISEELRLVANVIALLNQKHAGNITFNSSIEKSGLSKSIIPGSLQNLLEYIIRGTIITKDAPLKVDCYLEDGYLILEHQLNDRLKANDQSARWKEIQDSYTYFTDLPMIEVKAFEIRFIKVPVLELEPEIAVHS
ncbi:MAG: histidine kinase [Cyclobacteriaceae bacterium]